MKKKLTTIVVFLLVTAVFWIVLMVAAVSFYDTPFIDPMANTLTGAFAIAAGVNSAKSYYQGKEWIPTIM